MRDEVAYRRALRPILATRTVPVTYPATVAKIVEQAAELGIPADAEVIADDDNDGGVAFRWHEQYLGRHRLSKGRRS